MLKHLVRMKLRHIHQFIKKQNFSLHHIFINELFFFLKRKKNLMNMIVIIKI